jgi:hypothetical protein
MSTLSIDVLDWLGGASDATDGTFGALSIVAGEQHTVLTDVHDSLAQTTRPTIRVPAIRVAEWLILHWWRLRWESRPQRPPLDWRRAHSMAALGEGIAWPPLEIASDGEFVQLTLTAEPQADVAGIRYLRDVSGLEIPAAEFERGVDAFLDVVANRISTIAPRYGDLAALRDELDAERRDEATARGCRWQARAGFDSGDAPGDWTTKLERVAHEAGSVATEEMLAALGSAADAPTLERIVASLKRSSTTVDLAGVSAIARSERGATKPWVRGAHAARTVRASLGLGRGPIGNDTLAQLLGVNLPISPESLANDAVAGGFRAHDLLGRTHVAIRGARLTSQRFSLGRLIGLAADLPAQEQVLPLSDATTAVQKFGRSFAQEFLCPWAELDAATDEDGTDADAIGVIADRYGVSEMLVTTTLVNRGKLDRSQLARFVA